jgi:DNA-directed RNA polymerase specialized sigma24 family protein
MRPRTSPTSCSRGRCRVGDQTFDAIVARHEPDLVRHSARVVGEGAAQDAFLAAWRAMAAGAEIRSLRPLLYTIAHRPACCITARSSAKGGGAAEANALICAAE